MLLIGSRALHYYGLLSRTPNDLDVIVKYDEFESMVARIKPVSVIPIKNGDKIVLRTIASDIIECEIAWQGSTADQLLSLVAPNSHVDTDPIVGQVLIPDLDVLYTLKSSHRFLKDSPHFLKTMEDRRILAAQGCKIPTHLSDWYAARVKETYTYAHPKLNVAKKDFFSGDGVKYVYDHDTIHVAMAHLAAPAYTYFKKPGSEVMCDKTLFWSAPDQTRLYSVLEEAYVLALERSQIPFKGKVRPSYSFDTALMKVCTSITSGWWRDFAYERYHDVRALYDPNYVDRFWKAVDAGVVKKLEGP